jgi:DMSO reductase anchor subunit
LAAGSSAGVGSVALVAGKYKLVFALRLILGYIGAGGLAAFLYRNAKNPDKSKFVFHHTYIVFVLVLTAEVLSRLLFYSAHVQIGI